MGCLFGHRRPSGQCPARYAGHAGVFVVAARPLAARNGVKLKVGGGAVVEGDRMEEAASAVAVARRVDLAMTAGTRV